MSYHHSWIKLGKELKKKEQEIVISNLQMSDPTAKVCASYVKCYLLEASAQRPSAMQPTIYQIYMHISANI